MSRKKVLFSVLAVLLVAVLAIGVSSCTQTPTAATSQPTQAAAPTQNQADPAPAEAKHFAGIKIVFFPGGNEGCPFASVVYKGALAAQKDLGCDVEYVWSDWDPNK